MEKKIFNKLTKEIFLEYGFAKNKNNYILNYSDNCILELEIPDNIELEKEPKTEYVPITLRKKVFYLKYYKRKAIRTG